MKLQTTFHEAANESCRATLNLKYASLLNKMRVAANEGEYSFTFQVKDISYEFLEFLHKEGFKFYINNHCVVLFEIFEMWRDLYNTNTEIEVEW